MTRNFTGRHMAMILVAFFAVVVAVNFVMARFATSTFGGVVVENSYVASQKYNRWLGEARAQQKLGWTAQVSRLDDRRVRVAVAGTGPDVTLTGFARHPLGRQPDRSVIFERRADGTLQSREPLPEGRWTLHLELREGDTVWRQEDSLQ